MKIIITILTLGLYFLGNAQNVGIGTLFPTNGRLVVNNNGSSSALVIYDSSTDLSLPDAPALKGGERKTNNPGLIALALRYFFS